MNEIDCKVLKILYRNNSNAKIKHIQSELLKSGYGEVRYSTIGSCIKRLNEQGYVIWEKYNPIKLSEKGISLAKELLRHSQLLEVFFYNELKISIDDAHRESEKFNLLLSCDTINKICQKYNHPRESPCGERILDSSDCYCLKI